jgi:DUF4097 and DUF4098 domain-containing protein YvlB
MPAPIRSVRILAIATMTSAALAGAACVDIVGADLGRFTEREEKHFAVSGKPNVSLKTFDGAIEVRTWDKAEVQVVIERRGSSKSAADSIEVKAEQDGDRITVEARVPHTRDVGFSFRGSRAARLIVSMPAAADLAAGSGDGAIDVEGVSGRIQLRSGDGRIRARAIAGEVDVHTGDGSVTVDGKLTGVRAHSGDGSVAIRADEGSTAGGDWDITTGDGSVTLQIPDSFGAELDAHTGDGGIRTQDVSVSNVTGTISRNSLRGRLGGGGHSVRVRTGDGSITIRRS